MGIPVIKFRAAARFYLYSVPALATIATLAFMSLGAPVVFPQGLPPHVLQSVPPPPVRFSAQGVPLPFRPMDIPNAVPQLSIVAASPAATVGTLTQLNNPPPFVARAAFLLTDGTILVQDGQLIDIGWWKLTPDNTGSYINGTWQQVASPGLCPNGFDPFATVYSPLYYGSAVLPDGRFVMIGGEYDYNYDYWNDGSFEVWTDQGAIYDPVANSWTCITAPSGWTRIGDAPTVVLPNGTFMIEQPVTTNDSNGEVATLNTSTNPPTFNTPFTPPGKSADSKSYGNEEGWTLLPDGEILTLEVWNNSDTTDTPALTFDPSTQSWIGAGTAPNPLVLIKSGGTSYYEIGPATLRPDGTVFAEGATGFNDIYNAFTGAWTNGPMFPIIPVDASTGAPEQMAAADAPAALLPDGNVLTAASPIDPSRGWVPPTIFYEFDGSSLTPVLQSDSTNSYYWDMLPLPTGQVLITGASNVVYIYTPAGAPNPSWAPTITSSPARIETGAANYVITGTQFNGLSQAAAFGDDYQAATNYPLVRISNNGTGHVIYARTHTFSTMAVATGNTPVSAEFDVPSNAEPGASTLAVVANGIVSQPVDVYVSLAQLPLNVSGSRLSGTHSNLVCPSGTGDNCFLETASGSIQKTINGVPSGGNLTVSLYADMTTARRGPLFGSCYTVQGSGAIANAKATSSLKFDVIGWVCDSATSSSYGCIVGPLSLSIDPGIDNFATAAGTGTFNAQSPSCFSTPNDVQVSIKGVLTK